jgi:hypothetical protein
MQSIIGAGSIFPGRLKWRVEVGSGRREAEKTPRKSKVVVLVVVVVVVVVKGTPNS